jgi:negative regulator of sigma E activity
MGDALRGGLPKRLSSDFAARVQSALAEEPTVLAPPRRAPSSHPRLVAGWAVAASVAAVASTGLWLADRGGSNGALQANVSSVASNRPVVRLNSNNPGNDPDEPADAQAQAYFDQVKLNPYLFDYSENRPNVGPLPYGRIVSYERMR